MSTVPWSGPRTGRVTVWASPLDSSFNRWVLYRASSKGTGRRVKVALGQTFKTREDAETWATEHGYAVR